jgi:hypothetical protein
MRSACFTLFLLASAACASAGCGVPVYRYGVRYEILVPSSALPRCSDEHPTGCSLDGRDTTPAEASEAAPDPDPGQLAPYLRPATLEPFDLQGARSALASVDMMSCRAHDLGRGYLHARVTFAPSGRVGKAQIDRAPGEPADLSDDARVCVAGLLTSVSVPPFRGEAGTVTSEWFLP